MTHFYMEIHSNSIKRKSRNTIKTYYKKKFPITQFIEDESFLLYIGDFIKKNYNYKKQKNEHVFSFNDITKPVLNESNKRKFINKHQVSYSPLIIYDDSTDEITIITDPFGLDFIYIAFNENRIILSSHIKYILIENPVLLNELDYDAMVEYLSGHIILGTKTLFTNIKLLPYNAHLRLENWKINPSKAITNSLEKYSFWYKFPDKFDEAFIDERLKDVAREIATLIKELISKTSEQHKNKNSFFLSGGLDSRILVASIPDELKSKSVAYTFDSKQNGMEMKNASNIAKLLKISHNKVIINSEYIIKNCYRHMWMNEGYSNHIVSILLKLIELNEESQVFFDGYSGDLQFGGELLIDIDNVVKKHDQVSEQLKEIMIRLAYSFPDKPFREIFNNQQDFIDEILKKGYNDHCSLMWKINNKNQKLECLLQQTRSRGYTIGGPRTVINYGPTILPYYHPELFDKYIVVPQDLRKKRKFEKLTLRFVNLELSQQPATSLKWSNRFASAKFVQFGFTFLKKLERIFRFKIIPSYSSVPYFEWIREKGSYYQFLVDLIDNQNSLIWNVLDFESTRKFFYDFVKRKHHHHKFLLHIIDLEMILRLYYSLKEDDLPITLIGRTNKFRKEFHIEINLDYLTKITQFINS